ncbi:MAG: hypothetical protein IJ794_16210 [Lachnospiraceae bacterium]|nr:hypothetical protein [Lachnospiraceae bacterium]
MADGRKTSRTLLQNGWWEKDGMIGVLGLGIELLLLLPCMILGENAIYTYHDQLDGEMIAYLLQAKHLGDGSILPEFMGGAAKTALIPPAPGAVLLFVLFPPLKALCLLQVLGCVTGYAGMYLLVHKKTGNVWAAVVAGILYALVPFLPVYGLSQYGLPLLLWCVLTVRDGDHGMAEKSCAVREDDGGAAGAPCGTADDPCGEMAEKTRTVAATRRKYMCCIGYGILFALNSSLVLDGFAVLAVLAVWCVADWIRHKRFPAAMVGMGVAMTGVYMITNLSLLAQVLGIGGTEVSHKAEYVLAAESFWTGVREAFLYGGQHSIDHHGGILILAVAVLCGGAVRAFGAGQKGKAGRLPEGGPDRTGKAGRLLIARSGCGGVILACMGCNLLFASISALWNSSLGIALRGHMGAAGAFQMDRFLWLSPCLWYLTFGCLAAYAFERAGLRGLAGQTKKAADRTRQTLLTAVLLLATVAVAGGTGLSLFKDSDVKSNLQKLRNPAYSMMSYGDYYAVGVLEQVRDYLKAQTGLTQEEYRVVSLGIDPAAALYHGFYCLDGYSNNYSLAYKHAFRKVIAPALEQSEYLRAYFDDWGNRCYIFGTESPGYYTIAKGGFYFQHLELDTVALQELGGNYLLSAAYIANSEELGLKLLQEEPFETPDSYYRIFLYEVGNE